MALFERRLDDEFGGRRIFEIACDIGFEVGLITFESEEIISAVIHDRVGDLDLATHGVDGDERAGELPVLGKVVEQLGDGGDLVGFLRNRELRQGQTGVGSVGAERMQRLQALAFIVGAPRGLPVDGDEVVTIGPQRSIQLSKHRPKSLGSMRFTRSRSQRWLGMPK